MKRLPALLTTALAALCLAAPVAAADYPTKPLKLIVPYPPGAGTDAVSRLVADRLAVRLGQPVVVENRVGADGNIGTDAMAKAAPDGYTLGVATPGPVAVGKSLYPNLPYDPVRDLVPVIRLNEAPVVLLVNPSVPAKSVAELVALAKANPGKLNAAIAANGSMNHLVTELFKHDAGVNIVSIPYKGGAPAIQDILGGRVEVLFISVSSVVPQVEAGKLRALAVAAPSRSPFLPSVPTMAEAGLPGVVGSQWNGIVVPAGTPQPIVDKLNAEMQAILADPDMKERFAKLGMTPIGGSPQSFGDFVKGEQPKWAGVIKSAGIKAE